MIVAGTGLFLYMVQTKPHSDLEICSLSLQEMSIDLPRFSDDFAIGMRPARLLVTGERRTRLWNWTRSLPMHTPHWPRPWLRIFSGQLNARLASDCVMGEQGGSAKARW